MDVLTSLFGLDVTGQPASATSSSSPSPHADCSQPQLNTNHQRLHGTFGWESAMQALSHLRAVCCKSLLAGRVLLLLPSLQRQEGFVLPSLYPCRDRLASDTDCVT